MTLCWKTDTFGKRHKKEQNVHQDSSAIANMEEVLVHFMTPQMEVQAKTLCGVEQLKEKKRGLFSFKKSSDTVKQQ